MKMLPIAVGFAAVFSSPCTALASPCTGNFVLSSNGYWFDVRLDRSPGGGVSGRMTETSGPSWGNSVSYVDGQCDGTMMRFYRHIDTGIQEYTAYPLGNGWSGIFTTPNDSRRYAFTLMPR